MKFSEDKAIYLQIAHSLMDDILAERLKEGERMPSVREVAAQMEVNVNTVVRSFDYLSQREIIFQRRGLGFFVSDGAQSQIASLRREEFFHSTLPEVIKTMKKLGLSAEEIYEELKKKC